MNDTNSFNQDIERRTHIVSLLNTLSSGVGGNRLDTIAKLRNTEKSDFLEVVRTFLEDPDVEKRRVAVEALIETDPENHIEFALPLLNDADPGVRAEVIYRIKQARVVQSKKVIDQFVKALRKNPSPEVRTQAAEVLGICRTPEAKDALLWAAEHDFGKDSQGYTVSYIAKMALERLASGDM